MECGRDSDPVRCAQWHLANALDLSELVLTSGEQITVRENWPHGSRLQLANAAVSLQARHLLTNRIHKKRP
jgi:hypothetical protein